MYNIIKCIIFGLFKMIIEEIIKIGVFFMIGCIVCFILDIVFNI